MKNVEQDQDAREVALPPSVQEALGELVNAAKDGLLALSVGVGLGVLNAAGSPRRSPPTAAAATPAKPGCGSSSTGCSA